MTLSETFLRFVPRFAMRRVVAFLEQGHSGRVELHVDRGRISRVACTDYVADDGRDAETKT